MKKLFAELGIMSLIFLGLDGIWVGLIMNQHFQDKVKEIQGSDLEPNYIAAALCYVVLIGGLYYFVINQVKKFDVLKILFLAVPFGGTVYGTYDFTTAAIFKGWDFGTCFMDFVWGMVLCGTTAIGTKFLSSYFFRDEDENMNHES